MFSAPLSGMRSAESLLNNTAMRIAAGTAASPAAVSAQAPDSVQLTDQMTSLLMAITQFEANSSALEAEASMAESSFSITA